MVGNSHTKSKSIIDTPSCNNTIRILIIQVRGKGAPASEKNIQYNPLARLAPLHCRRKAQRFLIPDHVTHEELKVNLKGTVSVCIAFENARHAHRLIQLHPSRCIHTRYTLSGLVV